MTIESALQTVAFDSNQMPAVVRSLERQPLEALQVFAAENGIKIPAKARKIVLIETLIQAVCLTAPAIVDIPVAIDAPAVHDVPVDECETDDDSDLDEDFEPVAEPECVAETVQEPVLALDVTLNKRAILPILSAIGSLMGKYEKADVILEARCDENTLQIVVQSSAHAAFIPLKSCHFRIWNDGIICINHGALKSALAAMENDVRLQAHKIKKVRTMHTFEDGELIEKKEFEDDTVLTVSDKYGKTTLPCPEQEFLDFPTEKPQFDAQVEVENLLPALSRCAAATDSENVKYALGGILLEFENGTGTAVATDGYRVVTERLNFSGESAMRIIVPMESVRFLQSVFPHFAEFTVSCNAKELVFFCENAIFRTRILEGSFPRWQGIIPKKAETMTVSAKSVKDGIRRVQTVGSNGFGCPIFLSVAENALLFRAESELGKSEYKVPLNGAVIPFSCKVDGKLLEPLLTGDVVSLQNPEDDASAMVIYTETGINVLMTMSK